MEPGQEEEEDSARPGALAAVGRGQGGGRAVTWNMEAVNIFFNTKFGPILNICICCKLLQSSFIIS